MSKVTRKGQVTIPVEVRRRLDIDPGDELRFVVEGDVARVQVIKQTPLSELYGVFETDAPYPGKTEIREAVARDRGQKRSRSD